MNLLSAIEWQANPILIQLGPLRIAWYGALFATGFMLGSWLMGKIFQWEGKEEKDLESLFVYVIIGTIVGARLGHCLFYQPEYYLKNPLLILKVWEGGLASHGGTIGVLLGVWLFCKKKGHKYFAILDNMAMPTLIAAGFIRSANFINSEIVGSQTDLPWGVIFLGRKDLPPVPHHPAQLYEALCYFSLIPIMFYLYKKTDLLKVTGRMTGIFMAWVFGGRFLIEFIKLRQADFNPPLGISMGQWLSIPTILFGLYMLFLYKDKKETLKAP